MGSPDHLGLAYGAWAPVEGEGKVPDGKRRDGWLQDLSSRSISPDYRHAFRRWEASFTAPGDRLLTLELSSRLLIGHGNPSPTDVGLTLHHTWGVPVIPGTALKGLLAHFVDSRYGPACADLPPWEQQEDERERARYQAVTWRDRQILRGPGEVHRALFGAPDAKEDDQFRERGFGAGAAAGLVTFHDALYVPGSAEEDQPFATDVLTVHQHAYYEGDGEKRTWPNDHDGPRPVAFLTVRPKARMLLALSGPPDWTELTEKLLVDALGQWGVGGKTAAGYGRLAIPGQGSASALEEDAVSPPGKPARQRGDRVTVKRVEDPTGKGKVKFIAPDGVLGHFGPGEAVPPAAIGDTVEVWIANVTGDVYMLTLRPPKEKSRSKGK
jgi:CRISPR-associated protein Cmr6